MRVKTNVPIDSSSVARDDAHALQRHGAPGEARRSIPSDRQSLRFYELDRELRAIASAEASLDVRRARCLRDIEREATWRYFGYPTILAYLEDRLGVGPRTVRDRLRVARELGALPQIEAALEAGLVSHSIARELCRVADADTEATWLDRIRGRNQRDVEELVRGHRKGAHPDDDKSPDLEYRKITIEMSPATYALYRETLSALSNEAGRPVEEQEAIATMCRRTLEPTEAVPQKAPYQIATTICATCRRGWRDGAGAVVELDPADVEIALCDAEHIGSLDAAHPARAHQDVSPATRRLVWRRDHGRCRVEGCRSARNLDVHHVVHRSDGGGHDAENLVVMCSGCHAALHRGLIDVSGSAPTFVFRHRDSVADEPCRDEYSNSRDVGPRVDAISCLMTSGFKRAEAMIAVDAALAHVGHGAAIDAVVREALRRCHMKNRG